MAKKYTKTFRELEHELANVMLRIEQADYDELDELLKDYELGKQLLKQLEEKLNEAKNSITKVKKG